MSCILLLLIMNEDGTIESSISLDWIRIVHMSFFIICYVGICNEINWISNIHRHFRMFSFFCASIVCERTKHVKRKRDLLFIRPRVTYLSLQFHFSKYFIESVDMTKFLFFSLGVVLFFKRNQSKCVWIYFFASEMCALWRLFSIIPISFALKVSKLHELYAFQILI